MFSTLVANKRWQDAAMIGTLMLVYVASYAFVSAIPDTNRDIFLAQGIVSGRHFPLEGPILGGAMHLGPIWYYLMAIPLVATSSWLTAALFVGVMASLKFPLAYLCGKKLIDTRFGLLWALLLALPGWHDYERLTLFNPNPAAAFALGLAYLAIRFRAASPSYPALLGCGLLLGIAIHIHPTVAIAGLLPLVAIFSQTVASPWLVRRFYQLTCFGLGALIPFLPYVVSQFLHGYPDAVSVNAYVQQSLVWTNWSKLPLMLWGLFVVGPYLALRYIAQVSGVFLVLACVMIAATYTATALGLLRLVRSSRHGRIVLIVTLAGTLVALAWVLVLRTNTPAYFTFWLAPVCAGLVALGLTQFRLSKAIILFVFISILLLSMRTTLMIARTMSDGVGALPSSQDIKQFRPADLYVDIWLPAYAHAEMGAFMCSLPVGASLHGPLAHAADWNVNVDALLACGRPSAARLGGVSAEAQILGMPRLFWQGIGTMPECYIGPTGISRQPRVLKSFADEIASGSRYLPRDFSRTESHDVVLRFNLTSAEALLITNYLFPYFISRIESVSVNGITVTPRATTEMARIYAPPAQPVSVGNSNLNTWEIVIALATDAGLDIVAVPIVRSQPISRPSACRI